MNRVSRIITQKKSQGASQAMLYALGLTPLDIKKTHVGICSVWYEGNPSNAHLNILADKVKDGISDFYPNTLLGFRFNTVGAGGSLLMGTKGPLYSLPSREIIADSLETTMNGQYYDANISIAGGDSNIPGCLMGMIRINRPSIIIYGGNTTPGVYKGKDINILDGFDSYRKMVNRKIEKEDREELLEKCYPGPGSSGYMDTANTMAIATEAMGMMLPNGSSNMSMSIEKNKECYTRVVHAIFELMQKDIKPSDIITKRSLENAITTMIAFGGSTNGVLHIIAIAKTAGIDITIDDFNRISGNVSDLGDLKASRKHVMYDIYKDGGTSLILKHLLNKRLIYGDCITVTGKTLEENLEKISLDNTHFMFNPEKKSSHIRIFKGNLAEDSAVGRITSSEEYFRGPAKVFNNEDDFIESLKNKGIEEGDVIIIRYQGPVGGPGMPEMLKPLSAIRDYNFSGKVAFLTDGRLFGDSSGLVIGHISPEAHLAGRLAIVNNGDIIEIDAKKNTITLEVSEEEIEKRFIAWTIPKNNQKGYLKKYTRLVSSASNGCVTC